MSAYPIAPNAAAAQNRELETARTEREAAAKAGSPVFLAVEWLDRSFPDVAAAEAEIPALYGDGRYELGWRDGAWRVAVRYWRPAPPAPVARSVELAVRRPLGAARTPQEAAALLGAPAELAHETLPKLHRTHAQAQAKHPELFAAGLAALVEREGRFAVQITYWRPLPGSAARALLAAERAEIAARQAAPLRPNVPQSPLTTGLFAPFDEPTLDPPLEMPEPAPPPDDE
jgi:hypothetical protein